MEEIKENKIKISGDIKEVLKITNPNIKSFLIIGDEYKTQIGTDVKFNKLQKFMWKKFFNIKVEDI